MYHRLLSLSAGTYSLGRRSRWVCPTLCSVRWLPAAVLDVVGQIAAGAVAAGEVGPGQAMQINTGAPIPPGADAVVPVEDTQPADDGRAVRVLRGAQKGESITARGTYVTAGREVLLPGTWISPLEIGVAATAGATRVRVYRRPTVAIVVTGDELVDVDQVPRGAQIRNSNEHILDALVRQSHCKPVRLGVVSDDRAAIRAKIEAALACDVLCITGGVSMGEFDFVPEVLSELGATLHVHKMATKPGRPTIFATTPTGRAVFALPGNPISAFVGFHLLVSVALARLQGRQPAQHREIVATLRGPVPAPGDRRSFQPARAWLTAQGRWEAEPLSWHGSGDPFGMATANALVMRPAGSPPADAGDEVMIILVTHKG